VPVEMLEMWKYQDRIRRRQVLGLAVSMLIFLLAAAVVIEPELNTRLAVAVLPETLAGRRGAIYLIDRELDRALAAYRSEESARQYLTGRFESLRARDDGLFGELLQRERYLETMKKHVLALQAGRRRLAVKAGVQNRVDREIDYGRLDDER